MVSHITVLSQTINMQEYLRRLVMKVCFLGNVIIALALNGAMAYAECSSTETSEVVVHHEVVEYGKQNKACSKDELLKINAAKAIVKKYFVSSNKEIYSLFSKSRKDILLRVNKISNADQYSKAIGPSERVFTKEVYEKAEVGSNENYVQINVLVHWSEEGYQGVMTYIFTMEFEGGEWKIVEVKY